jgi:hypothetical protein
MNPKMKPEKEGREEGQAPERSDPRSAHSLEDEANSQDTLQGYAAMNAVDEHSEIAEEAAGETSSDDREEIARLAYQYHQERGGHHGSHEDDWYRAEQVVRERREKRAESKRDESKPGDSKPGETGPGKSR